MTGRIQEAFQRFMKRSDVNSPEAVWDGDRGTALAEAFEAAVLACADFVAVLPKEVGRRIGFDDIEDVDLVGEIAVELRAQVNLCRGVYQNFLGSQLKCRYLKRDDAGRRSCTLIEVWGDVTDCPHHARKVTEVRQTAGARDDREGVRGGGRDG